MWHVLINRCSLLLACDRNLVPGWIHSMATGSGLVDIMRIATAQLAVERMVKCSYGHSKTINSHRLFSTKVLWHYTTPGNSFSILQRLPLRQQERVCKGIADPHRRNITMRPRLMKIRISSCCLLAQNVPVRLKVGIKLRSLIKQERSHCTCYKCRTCSTSRWQ